MLTRHGRWCSFVALVSLTFAHYSNGNPAVHIERVNEGHWTDSYNYETHERPVLNFWARQTHELPPIHSPKPIENQTILHIEEWKMNFPEVTTAMNQAMLRGSQWRDTRRLADKEQVDLMQLEMGFKTVILCTICKKGAGLIQHYIETGKSVLEIVEDVRALCESLHFQTLQVCEGLAKTLVEKGIHILGKVTPDSLCGFLIGDGCGDNSLLTSEWSVRFPPVPKPQPKPIPLLKQGGSTLKVLHISDTHFDPHYEEGTNAVCNEPLCCRLTNGPAPNPQAAAGRWGDYRNCDTPKRTFVNMLEHINRTHPDIDYIIWTGGMPPHDSWNQKKEDIIKIFEETLDQLSKTFGIPIFPALGSHESFPVNRIQSPPFPNENSIDKEINTQWEKKLPIVISHKLQKGGFYSVLVRPRFRIISLNTHFCNKKNWWLLLNSKDPADELRWFIEELQRAEFSKEKVHVIGSVPPGHRDCLKVWSRNYYSIINRYESTIAAQFFGYTHFDEFEVFYDIEDMSRAVSIAYIGPSVTPYNNLNPGYRIYYVDGDSDGTVIDHETWVMSLKQANLHDYPIWYKEYSARQRYEMPSLSPVEWDKFLHRLKDDDRLFEMYYKHYWKNSPMRPSCDSECKKRMLCDLRSGRSHDREALCQEIESRMDDVMRREIKICTNNYTMCGINALLP